MYRYTHESFYITYALAERIIDEYDLVYCSDIEAYAERDEAYYIEDCDEWVHDNSDYYYCSQCGCWYSSWAWNDRLDCCNNCAEDLMMVKPYHYHKGSYTYYGNVPYRIGAEIEVDTDNWCAERDRVARSIDEYLSGHAVYEEDGSLSDEGFEIITEPHTIDEFFKLNWREVFQILIDEDYRAHDSGNCGLHLHFSREWFGETEAERVQNVARLVMFYDKNFDTLYRLSRRTQTDYCERDYISRDFTDIESDEDAERLVDSKKCSSRYTAVNLTNYDRIGTIEFRLGRGTLNYDTFRAWIDIHRAIAEQSRRAKTYDFNEWINSSTVEPNTMDYVNRRLGGVTPIDSDTQNTIERDPVDEMTIDEFISMVNDLIDEDCDNRNGGITVCA